jgi:hypothetical protein
MSHHLVGEREEDGFQLGVGLDRGAAALAADYPRDETFQAEYAKSAGSQEAWERFAGGYLSGDEAAYQKAVRRFHESRAASP